MPCGDFPLGTTIKLASVPPGRPIIRTRAAKGRLGMPLDWWKEEWVGNIVSQQPLQNQHFTRQTTIGRHQEEVVSVSRTPFSQLCILSAKH